MVSTNRQRLTQSIVDKAPVPEGKSPKILMDAEVSGFGLRVFPSGVKSYILRYQWHGRTKYLKISDAAGINVVQARKLAAEKLLLIQSGVDPTFRDCEKRFADLAESFLTDYAKVKKKTWAQDERRLNKFLLPAFKKFLVEDIRRIDVDHLHKKIGRNNGQREANIVLSLISKIFNYGISAGFLPDDAINSAARIERYKENKRDRWIKPGEMPQLIDAIRAEPRPEIRSGILLYLLTGLRNSELVKLRWDEIETIEVDGQRSGRVLITDNKSDRPFHLPLSSAAIIEPSY